MRPRLVQSIVLSATLVTLGLRADDISEPQEPKSVSAKKAKDTFSDEVKKLDADYTKKLRELQKQYLDDLENARKLALEKSDLDEAQRILSAHGAVQETQKADPVRPGGFQILYAKHGGGSKWVDRTGDVRKKVKDGRLSLNASRMNWPDPAFGWAKALVVVYSAGGKVELAIEDHDQLLELPVRRRR